MNLKRMICLALALLLAMGTVALAETDAANLQAQLDAANERIAELEGLVEKYQPVYESQVVATYGEDGVIWKDDAQKQYDNMAAMYQQYGISVDSFAAEIKQSVLESLVQDAVLEAKAQELGLSDLDEDTLAELTAQAETSYNNYVEQYKSYFAKDSAGNDVSDEDAVAQTKDYLAQNGLTPEVMTENVVKNYVSEQLHTAVTADVTVSDEEVQAKYAEMVAADQENYADNDFNYNSARSQGTAIAWNPEGYRAVKHVLVKFNEEQATQYNALKNAIDDLNDELEALEHPEEAAEAEAAAEDEPAVEAEDEDIQAVEPVEEAAEEPRTREEIQADLGAAGVELEALYSELMPKAQEVVDAFNGGADFDALIEQYGEDPGMKAEPSKTQGYAVKEGSTYWESAFTEGAMSIAEVGQISEPVRGSNGIHIIYYMGDIPAGEVAFEDIAEQVTSEAQEDKVSETYDAQVKAWMEEAAPAYFADKF